jgi:hypothetical protein
VSEVHIVSSWAAADEKRSANGTREKRIMVGNIMFVQVQRTGMDGHTTIRIFSDMRL